MTIDKLLEGKEFSRPEARQIINIAEYSEGQEKSRKNVEKALSHLDAGTGDRYLFSLMRVIRAELDKLEEEAPRDENYDSWMCGEIRKAMLQLSIREDEIMSDKVSYTPEEVVGALSEMYPEDTINQALRTKMGWKDYSARTPQDLKPRSRKSPKGGTNGRFFEKSIEAWNEEHSQTLVNIVKGIPEEERHKLFVADDLGTPYNVETPEEMRDAIGEIQKLNRGVRLIYVPDYEPEGGSIENYLTDETN